MQQLLDLGSRVSGLGAFVLMLSFAEVNLLTQTLTSHQDLEDLVF